MDLNTISLTLFGVLLLYGAYTCWLNYPKVIPQTQPITPWGQQVGRTRPIQSKNGDASMMTELNRRRAIQGIGCKEPKKIRESRTSSGSSTGAMESFFLTAICPVSSVPLVAEVCYDIFDGGYADGPDNCYIFDGNEEDAIVYDGGNPDTIVCGI